MKTKQRRTVQLLASVLGAAMLLGSHSASALGLRQAYDLALQNDPTYQSAVYDNESGKEYKVIGRSGLLPSLSGYYNATKNRADITAPNFLGQLSTTHPEYFSRSAVVQLRQPVFSLDALARYKQGKAQSNYSELVFEGRAQDLALRLVTAYADALYADDQVALVEAQREMYAEQKKVNERLLAKGEGTRTDVLEIQARYDLSEAQLIESKDGRITARNTLSGMIGTEVDVLDGLNDTFRVIPLAPADYESWKKLALENSPEVQAQVAAIEAAKQEINKARSGHTPRLDFVASYSKNSSETINTLGQESTVRSIGVQLNVPLYQGGYVNAISRQAVAALERAKADLAAKTDKTLIEVRKQFNLAQSSVARIAALDKSVESSQLLIKATEQSIKGGVRINLDLLNAQQQLFTAKRDLAQARYGYLLASLRLRAAAGTLDADDVRTVAGYFR
ncbi:MAG: TolC family outer membrane protein [Pseudomonadota bacterium]